MAEGTTTETRQEGGSCFSFPKIGGVDFLVLLALAVAAVFGGRKVKQASDDF